MANSLGSYQGGQGQHPQGGIEENDSRLVDSCCGKLRAWSGIDKFERGYLFLALVTALLMLAFSSHRIYVLNQDHKPYCSEIVMLLSEGFCLYYISHAIFFERYYDLYIYFVAIVVDIIYCTVDFAAIGTPVPYAKARLGLDWSLGCIIPCVLGFWLTRRFNFPRIIQQQAGGLKSDQDHFKRLFLFDSFLVVDLQLSVCNVVFIVTNRQVNIEEIAALVVGQTVNVIFFAIGKWVMLQIQRKQRHGAITFLFATMGAFPFLFFFYKAVKQRDGIAKRVYLDVASLVFSLLSVIFRVIILALCYVVSSKAAELEYYEVEFREERATTIVPSIWVEPEDDPENVMCWWPENSRLKEASEDAGETHSTIKYSLHPVRIMNKIKVKDSQEVRKMLQASDQRRGWPNRR